MRSVHNSWFALQRWQDLPPPLPANIQPLWQAHPTGCDGKGVVNFTDVQGVIATGLEGVHAWL